MTEQDINKAFAEVIETKEFKKSPHFTKFDRYDFKNKEVSDMRKLKVLWLMGKLKLV